MFTSKTTIQIGDTKTMHKSVRTSDDHGGGTFSLTQYNQTHQLSWPTQPSSPLRVKSRPTLRWLLYLPPFVFFISKQIILKKNIVLWSSALSVDWWCALGERWTADRSHRTTRPDLTRRLDAPNKWASIHYIYKKQRNQCTSGSIMFHNVYKRPCSIWYYSHYCQKT